MDDQARTTGAVRRTDPWIRHRRIEALQRAHRAREILDHEGELAARIRGRSRPLDDGPLDDVAARGLGPAEPLIDVDRATRGDAPSDRSIAQETAEDLDRLREIHRQLQHERRVARRPFHHRHTDRLVVALELAERLALERLGYLDYAEFEAAGADGRSGRDIIDLEHIERAQRDLADAEAILAELDKAGDPGDAEPWGIPRLPAWTVDPILRERVRLRTTWNRRALFGVPPVAEPMRSTSTGRMPIALPRRTPLAARVAARSTRTVAGGLDPDDDRVLGEIVRDGRRVRIEKAPGLPYVDDGTDVGPDAITYGDPMRLVDETRRAGPSGSRPVTDL